MNVQISLEDAMRAIAENSQRPTVILCDRSAQDSQACIVIIIIIIIEINNNNKKEKKRRKAKVCLRVSD